MELITTFLEITKGFVMPAGTVVVIFSASHLARTGTEGYLAEYDNARNHLYKTLGGGGW
jgi:hypothetical protein